MSEVLAIEDEPSFVDIITVLLNGGRRMKKHRVESSPTLSGGFAWLTRRAFDLVIVDLDLEDSKPEKTIAQLTNIWGAARHMNPKANMVVLTGMVGYDELINDMGFIVRNKADGDYTIDLPILFRRLLPEPHRGLFSWVAA